MHVERNIESLKLWVEAKNLTVTICKNLLPEFPEVERFALASQLRRSTQSVPANIAEAYGRYGYQDAIRFCYIARGSLVEVRSHVLVAFELAYISETDKAKLIGQINNVGKLLNGYINYLNTLRKGNE
jgi:four helix bundle protein